MSCVKEQDLHNVCGYVTCEETVVRKICDEKK